MEDFKLIAKTFQGLEEVLAKELNGLGAKNVTPGRRMVSFTGDKEMMYRANFCLHTAVRILKPIAEFKATNADEVYDAVKAIDWNKYLDIETSFSVDSVVYSEDFRHSKFVAYKVKDAIVDFFREKEGKRPNISVTNPDIKFNMHIAEDTCTLSLDSSGESLHKRGYRVATVESPINEVLAAGMIMLTGWKGECDLIDPMCGSGTIAIEAALLARNIAPGIFRSRFAFEGWKDFDKDLLEHIYNDESQEKTFKHHIYAYDIDKGAVNAALANIKSAGVTAEVTAEVQSIQQFKQPAEKAIMVTNPPYGERISAPNLLGLYRTIGEKLKHQFVDNEAWVIGYREETFDQIGLKPSLMIPLFNGSLDCELRKYQIFSGRLNNFREAGNILKTDEEKERNAAKRKLKPRKDSANGGNDDEEGTDIPDYLVRRHREFVQTQQHETRRHFRSEDEQRDNDRPRHGGGGRHGGGFRDDRRQERKDFRPSDRQPQYDRPKGNRPEHKDFKGGGGNAGRSFDRGNRYGRNEGGNNFRPKGNRPTGKRFNNRNHEK